MGFMVTISGEIVGLDDVWIAIRDILKVISHKHGIVIGAPGDL